jgi:NAD(P)-dependent dehydrogenase (short-subunit alcohol dehydrogenase family)
LILPDSKQSTKIKTMAHPRVALILGAGPNIGTSVAAKFASTGFKVAIASRSGTGSKNADGYLSVKADFTKPETIPAVFDAVKAEFNTAPSVVVYNAAALTNPPDQTSALSVPLDSFASDLNINTVSPYAAAQQAVAGWETLPADAKKSFIYTGNILNVRPVPVPMMINLGTGKSATSFWLQLADATYSDKGYRFYYADERKPDGSSKGTAIDGPAHGEFYAQLADHAEGIPWLATFVKDKGYVKF